MGFRGLLSELNPLIAISSVFFAFFGLTSAYMYGFTRSFGVGLAALIDSSLLFGAIQNLLILCTYTFAYTRLVMFPFFGQTRFSSRLDSVEAPSREKMEDLFSSDFGEMGVSARRNFFSTYSFLVGWINRLPIWILITIMLILYLLAFAIVMRDILDWLSVVLFALSSAFWLFVLTWAIVLTDKTPGTAGKKSLYEDFIRALISIVTLELESYSAKRVALLVSFLLVVISEFGESRASTLVRSDPFCFELLNGSITASLIASNNTGYIVYTSGPNVSSDEIGQQPGSFGFIERLSLVSIFPECD